jgi:hypothetical protein
MNILNMAMIYFGYSELSSLENCIATSEWFTFYIYIYIYIYTHTHTLIYIYTHTHQIHEGRDHLG